MKKSVIVTFNVECNWQGFPPDYRVFVNDELFAERTYRVNSNEYITEILNLYAEPGVYQIKFEPIEPKTGRFTLGEPRVEVGTAKVLGDMRFEII